MGFNQNTLSLPICTDRMEYEDDPVDILTSPNHMNQNDCCWVLDDDSISMNSCPQLSVVQLCLVQSHMLMIPYHEYSKFMIGVVDQYL
jgi:hypothetical protein